MRTSRASARIGKLVVAGVSAVALILGGVTAATADPPVYTTVTGTLVMSPAITKFETVRITVSQRLGENDRGQMMWSNWGGDMFSLAPGDGPRAFSFSLPPGTYRIQAATETFSPWPSWGPTFLGGTGLAAAATTITVGDGTPLDVGAITLLKAGGISGQINITDAEYEGASLELYSLNSQSGKFEFYQTLGGDFPTNTTPDGAFAIEKVPPGTYRLRIEGVPRLAPVFWPNGATIGEGQNIVVTSGETSTANATLTRPRTVVLGQRIAGANRYETAVAVTRQQFPPSATQRIEVLYIASGTTYPDALVAGPAAHEQGGALLLVNPSSVPASVWSEFQRLNPKRVVIVGGTPSVSAAVEAQFAGAAPTTRISGTNRYDTARQIVRSAFGCDDDICAPVIFVATGANYPDALAAGPAAGVAGAPVLLVDGAQDSLDAATVEILEELGSVNAHVLGSSDSVSEGIFDEIRTVVGPASYRYGGANRYETTALINAKFFDRAGTVFVATGTNFPDALAAGPLAAKVGSPLFLSKPNCAPPNFLLAANLSGEHQQSALEVLDTRAIRLLGDSNSISDSVATQTC